MLIYGYDVRILHAATGEIIRTLTINPEHRYHGTGKPVGGPRRAYGPAKTRNPNPDEGSDPCRRLARSQSEAGGIEPLREVARRTWSGAICPGQDTCSGVRQ